MSRAALVRVGIVLTAAGLVGVLVWDSVTATRAARERRKVATVQAAAACRDGYVPIRSEPLGRVVCTLGYMPD